MVLVINTKVTGDKSMAGYQHAIALRSKDQGYQVQTVCVYCTVHDRQG